MSEKTISTKIKQRIDTSTNWSTSNSVLLDGEIGIESDTTLFKVGNGSSTWNNLSYSRIKFDASGNDISSVYTKKSSLSAVATSGSYTDLTNKPTIPTVNNATLTIQKNGTSVGTFTANASTAVTTNITVPTKTSELTNDSGYKTTDNNTTYTLSGVVSATNGKAGVTLTPSSGTAKTVTITGSGATTITSGTDGNIVVTSTDTNTTYNVMTGATSSTAGSSGLVPTPASGKNTSFLRGDGTWVVPTDTTYSAITTDQINALFN